MKMKQEPTKHRKEYHNIESYDDTVDIVEEILEIMRREEKAILKDFEKAAKEIVKAYRSQFPLYYTKDALNKELYRIFLLCENMKYPNELWDTVNKIKKDLEQKKTTYLGWLNMIYELTMKETHKSVTGKTAAAAPQLHSLLIPENINQRINESWCKDGKTFMDRINIIIKDFDDKLHSIIKEGLYKGWSIDYMTKKLIRLTGMEAYKARRLIRTESMAAWSKATKDTYLADGIEYVEIIGDAECGRICLDYVGDKISLAEAQIGDDLPPYHPNCACSFCAYTEFDGE